MPAPPPTDSDPPLPEFAPGWVWLVGAGPGDPGLLTVTALHALRHADRVVYDALVDRRILALANPGAELIYAGKRGGKPSPKQPDISARLVRAGPGPASACCGSRAATPFVFGRGAEEALALVAAGVPFRVVPGITAGTGGLAYAGIPLTHRETNSAVTFITGHDVAGATPDALDWHALANGAPVLVVYMPLKHLAEIAARLIAHGRSADEPAAIVAHAATDRQQVVETTLGAAPELAHTVDPPALFVVGPVVALRAGLDWLGALAGRELAPDPLATRRTRAAS